MLHGNRCDWPGVTVSSPLLLNGGGGGGGGIAFLGSMVKGGLCDFSKMGGGGGGANFSRGEFPPILLNFSLDNMNCNISLFFRNNGKEKISSWPIMWVFSYEHSHLNKENSNCTYQG